jgi:alpha-1,6-mannosyltransferase
MNEVVAISDPQRRNAIRLAIVALVALAAIAMLAWTATLSYGNTASQFFASAMLTLFGFACVLWIGLDRGFNTLSTTSVLLVLIFTRMVALFVAPLLEDDHYRYLWDGFVTATTGQPFAHAPSHIFTDTHVPPSMQAALNGINNPDIPTIYGPLLQAFFAGSYWIAPGALWPFKLMLLGAEIAIALLLRSANVSPRWLLIYALHPLVFKESAITAHPDVLIGAALLAATLVWLRGREAAAALFVCAAIAMKLSAVVALPFFFVNRRGGFSVRGAVAAIAALSVLVALSVIGGGGELRALATFGEQWTFNPLLFRLVAYLFDDSAARAIVAIAFVAIAVAIALKWWFDLRRNASSDDTLPPPIVAVFTALLLLSPVVNPWYWLWLFPLALIDHREAASRVAMVAASVSLLAYAHVGAQVAAQSSITSFAVPWWATAVQLSIIAIAAVRAMQRRDNRSISTSQRGVTYE